MAEMFFLVLFVVFSTAFAIAALIASFICSYNNSSDEKSSTYECGMKLFSDAKLQYNIKYFNYAILFLIFDIETFFLFPFAVKFNQLASFAVIEAFIFVSLLLLALIFAVKKKVLRFDK